MRLAARMCSTAPPPANETGGVDVLDRTAARPETEGADVLDRSRHPP
jgi:hypothetical protein